MTKEEINIRLAKLLAQADTNSAILLRRSESALLRSYKSSLENIKKEILKMFEKYGDAVKYNDMMIYNRLINLEKSIAEEIKSLTGEGIKTITKTIKDIYSTNFYRTGFALESAIGIKLGYGLINSTTVQASVLNPLDRIKWPERLKDHSQKYMSQIRQELTQGLIQGKGYVKIAKAVTDKTSISANNALRIIRTEGHRVQNASRIVAFEKSESAGEEIGIKTTRIWIATLDNKTRDTHASLDGIEADENGLFTTNSGSTGEGPGLFGVPEEDINCRCSIGVQIGGLKPSFRKDNESKLMIPYKTYQEWYDGRILKK